MDQKEIKKVEKKLKSVCHKLDSGSYKAQTFILMYEFIKHFGEYNNSLEETPELQQKKEFQLEMFRASDKLWEDIKWDQLNGRDNLILSLLKGKISPSSVDKAVYGEELYDECVKFNKYDLINIINSIDAFLIIKSFSFNEKYHQFIPFTFPGKQSSWLSLNYLSYVKPLIDNNSRLYENEYFKVHFSVAGMEDTENFLKMVEAIRPVLAGNLPIKYAKYKAGEVYPDNYFMHKICNFIGADEKKHMMHSANAKNKQIVVYFNKEQMEQGLVPHVVEQISKRLKDAGLKPGGYSLGDAQIDQEGDYAYCRFERDVNLFYYSAKKLGKKLCTAVENALLSYQEEDIEKLGIKIKGKTDRVYNAISIPNIENLPSKSSLNKKCSSKYLNNFAPDDIKGDLFIPKYYKLFAKIEGLLNENSKLKPLISYASQIADISMNYIKEQMQSNQGVDAWNEYADVSIIIYRKLMAPVIRKVNISTVEDHNQILDKMLEELDNIVERLLNNEDNAKDEFVKDLALCMLRDPEKDQSQDIVPYYRGNVSHEDASNLVDIVHEKLYGPVLTKDKKHEAVDQSKEAVTNEVKNVSLLDQEKIDHKNATENKEQEIIPKPPKVPVQSEISQAQTYVITSDDKVDGNSYVKNMHTSTDIKKKGDNVTPATNEVKSPNVDMRPYIASIVAYAAMTSIAYKMNQMRCVFLCTTLLALPYMFHNPNDKRVDAESERAKMGAGILAASLISTYVINQVSQRQLLSKVVNKSVFNISLTISLNVLMAIAGCTIHETGDKVKRGF